MSCAHLWHSQEITRKSQGHRSCRRGRLKCIGSGSLASSTSISTRRTCGRRPDAVTYESGCKRITTKRWKLDSSLQIVHQRPHSLSWYLYAMSYLTPETNAKESQAKACYGEFGFDVYVPNTSGVGTGWITFCQGRT